MNKAAAQRAGVARVERSVHLLQGRAGAIEAAVADVGVGGGGASVVARAVEIRGEGVRRIAGVVVAHVGVGHEVARGHGVPTERHVVHDLVRQHDRAQLRAVPGG